MRSRFTLIHNKILKMDREQLQAKSGILSRTKYYWVIEKQNVCLTFISSTNYLDKLVVQCETHCSVNKQRSVSGMRIMRFHQSQNQKIPPITRCKKGVVLPGGNAYWKWEIFSPQSFLKLSTNVVCHCLLLMIGSMPCVVAKKTSLWRITSQNLL